MTSRNNIIVLLQSWTVFWYEEGRSLSWLPMLWQNRDPLVRASAIQLLAGLMNIVHTMSQLLNAIVMAPSDLCHTLLQYITNKEECCLVKEEACIAFSNMLKNCSIMSFHCVSVKKISICRYKIRKVKYIQENNFFE